MFNISPAHLVFASRNRAQHWWSMVMGIMNRAQANPRRASRPSLCAKRTTGHRSHPQPWGLLSVHPKGSVLGKCCLQGQSSPGKPRHRQFPGYKVFVFCTERLLPAGEIQGMKTLGHYQPESTHAINDHYFCTAYCLAPRPHLALLSAPQLYTRPLPHGLQTMQLLGWLLKLQIRQEDFFFLISWISLRKISRLKKTKKTQLKLNPTIKWLLQGLHYFFLPYSSVCLFPGYCYHGLLPSSCWQQHCQALFFVVRRGAEECEQLGDRDRGNHCLVIAKFQLFPEHN